MSKIKVMVNGAPGRMASAAIGQVLADERFELIPASLTGPEIQTAQHKIDSRKLQLIRPEVREATIKEIRGRHGTFIAVDYTHPTAVNDNAEFYCRCQLPFVMGTTGGDLQRLIETVKNSVVSAVIAPNMGRQIVGFQAMMAYAAENFPGLFKTYSMDISESHQQNKADTSGTAKELVGYFQKLGLDFEVRDINKIRDPEAQKKEWGVPDAYLDGHAWHVISLVSEDKTVSFTFTVKINGRDIYAKGTLEAVEFLQKKIDQGRRGEIYSMIDVIRSG